MGTAEETKRIKRILLFVVLPLIIYGVAIGKLVTHKAQLEKDLGLKVGKIKHYYDNGFNVPDQKSIDARLQLIEESQAKVDSIATYSSHALPDVPADIAEPGIYFKEKLYLTQKGLRGLADSRQMTLPGNIGFDEKLPEKSVVPVLLLKLKMADKLLRILIENQAKKVHLVEFLESQVMRDKEDAEMPSENVSLKIHLDCQIEALKKILYEIGNLNPFVVVEGLRVEQTKEGLLDVQLHVTQLLYKGKS